MTNLHHSTPQTRCGAFFKTYTSIEGVVASSSRTRRRRKVEDMALRMWASSTANALKLSSSLRPPAASIPPFSLSRCFSTGQVLGSWNWVFVFGFVSGRFGLQLPRGCHFVLFCAVLDGLKYATSHEWVKHEGSVATVGITDHAQVCSSPFFSLSHCPCWKKGVFSVKWLFSFLLFCDLCSRLMDA